MLGYDVTVLSHLLYFSISHDALVSSVQMFLAKLESARSFVGVRFFSTLPCKLNGITFIRQVLTRGLRIIVRRNPRCMRQKKRLAKRLWEFGKPHVDIGLVAASGPSHLPTIFTLSASHASSLSKSNCVFNPSSDD